MSIDQLNEAPLRKGLALMAVCSCLTACAAFEALGGMPYAEVSVTLTSRPTPATVLDCVQSSILALSPEKEMQIAPGLSFKMKQGHWATDVTALNVDEGRLETGHYPESSIQGVRVRAVYKQTTSVLRLQIKAAGPYYVDLGAQAHVSELQRRVRQCVEAA